MALYNARGNFNVTTDSGYGLYSADGELRITIVPGTSFTGLYAVDGSINCVVVQSSATPQGLYHACGAMRVVEATSEYGVYAPNGAFYVSGASYSILMAGSETDVLTMASIDDTMTIRSTSDPTDDYQGTPGSKLTTTRASTAMYWDVNGILQSAATGTLRRDYDPRLSSTTERCGYLIEEARTNLELRSEDYENAAWTKTSSACVNNQSSGPRGPATMASYIESGGGNLAPAAARTIVSSSTYTIFRVLKRLNTDWMSFAVGDNTSPSNGVRVWFDLANGVKGNVTAAGTGWTHVASGIYSVGNGAYLCYITVTVGATTGYSRLQTASANGATTRADVGGGAGIGSGFYIDMAQWELGSFASSYIPTAGSTVTRAADLVTLAGTLFPLNQTEGTLYSKFMMMGLTANNQYTLGLDDGTNAERIALIRSVASSKASFIIVDSSNAQLGSDGIISSATLAALTQYKAAGAYKLNDSAAALIGDTVQTDIVCTMPTTTQMVVGGLAASSRPLMGWLFEVAYFPVRKDNATLAVLAAAA